MKKNKNNIICTLSSFSTIEHNYTPKKSRVFVVLAISFARAGCRIRGYATTNWTTVLHLHKFPFKMKRKENRNNQQGEEEKKRMVFKLAAFPSDSDKK